MDDIYFNQVSKKEIYDTGKCFDIFTITYQLLNGLAT